MIYEGAFHVDPNLGGLIAELARSPKKGLRLVDGVRLRDLMSPQSLAISDRPLGATAAQRHLMVAHRHEVARVLRQASYVAMRVRHRNVFRPRDGEGRVHEVDVVRWRDLGRAQVRRHVDTSIEVDEESVSIELLGRVIGASEPRPTPIELAVASMRLVPSPKTSIYAGMAFILTKELGQARMLLESVISGSPGSLLASFAWSNLAYTYIQVGRMNDATEAQRRAAYLEPGRGDPLLGWLYSAAQAGQRQELERASDAIQATLAEDAGVIEEHLELIAAQRSRGEWAPTREALSLIRQQGLRLSNGARRVLDVFS